MTEYYIQDTRQYVGNNMLFWAKGGGYTCHIDEAQIFSKEDAKAIHKNRKSDKPWRVSIIRKASTLQCDMQKVKR